EPDPLSHGLLTYALALAARVDRGTLSAEEASRLSAAMRADIDSAKGRLAEESGGPDAMLRWWAAHWRERGDRYAGTAAAPVRCEVTPGKDGRSRIGCL
ncbi:MAG TPA: hypothetical protein VMG58_16910, partial [Candidatus Sulfotelmatobacter sp.]|nr:hypothetical protein [Candidatus Sulfotelmatobacter sp.]